jgi:hypothetical protein
MRLSRPSLWLCGLILLLGCTAGCYFYLESKAEQRLQHTLAEAHRLDPVWRMADSYQSEPFVHEDQNGAAQRRAVRRLFPAGWRPVQLGAGPPEIRLDAALTTRLRKQLQESAPAVEAARALAYVPSSVSQTDAQMPPVIEAMEIARLLEWDAILLAQDHELEKAALSWRAILGTARTLGEGPNLMNALVRRGVGMVLSRSSQPFSIRRENASSRYEKFGLLYISIAATAACTAFDANSALSDTFVSS